MSDQSESKEDAFLLEQYSSDDSAAQDRPDSGETFREIILPHNESKYGAQRRPFDLIYRTIVFISSASKDVAAQFFSSTQLSYTAPFNVVKSIIVFLLPSFIVSWYTDNTLDPPAKIPSTAYLNGLRGIAAFFVWNNHFMTVYYSTAFQWGYHTRPEDVWVIQWPIVRVIHSGAFMVTIFFILSGFVLSIRPLQLAREREDQQLLKNLASSVFRRAPRLFLPLLPPLLLSGVCIHYQIFYEPGDQPLELKKLAATGTSLWEELGTAFWSWNRVINPFAEGIYYPPTIPPLWTLPIEFRGSILIFLLTLGFAKIRPSLRLLSFGGLALYFFYYCQWTLSLFIGGAVLAEIRLIRQEGKIPLEENSKPRGHTRFMKSSVRIFWIVVFIASIFMGSLPFFGAIIAPGFITLCAATPFPYNSSNETIVAFWSTLSSLLLLLALENCEILRKPFASAFARYLGDISFSLYVIHGPMMMVIGTPITDWLIHWTGNYDVGTLLGYTAQVPILIWLSDIQWRLCDENSLKFAKWLALKMAV